MSSMHPIASPTGKSGASFPLPLAPTGLLSMGRRQNSLTSATPDRTQENENRQKSAVVDQPVRPGLITSGLASQRPALSSPTTIKPSTSSSPRVDRGGDWSERVERGERDRAVDRTSTSAARNSAWDRESTERNFQRDRFERQPDRQERVERPARTERDRPVPTTTEREHGDRRWSESSPTQNAFRREERSDRFDRFERPERGPERLSIHDRYDRRERSDRGEHPEGHRFDRLERESSGRESERSAPGMPRSRIDGTDPQRVREREERLERGAERDWARPNEKEYDRDHDNHDRRHPIDRSRWDRSYHDDSMNWEHNQPARFHRSSSNSTPAHPTEPAPRTSSSETRPERYDPNEFASRTRQTSRYPYHPSGAATNRETPVTPSGGSSSNSNIAPSTDAMGFPADDSEESMHINKMFAPRVRFSKEEMLAAYHSASFPHDLQDLTDISVVTKEILVPLAFEPLTEEEEGYRASGKWFINSRSYHTARTRTKPSGDHPQPYRRPVVGNERTNLSSEDRQHERRDSTASDDKLPSWYSNNVAAETLSPVLHPKVGNITIDDIERERNERRHLWEQRERSNSNTTNATANVTAPIDRSNDLNWRHTEDTPSNDLSSKAHDDVVDNRWSATSDVYDSSKPGVVSSASMPTPRITEKDLHSSSHHMQEASFNSNASSHGPSSVLNQPNTLSGNVTSPASAWSTPDVWYYVDPQQQVQGPFSSLEMRGWFEKGYFDLHLRVQRNIDPTTAPLTAFIPLGVWFSRGDKAFLDKLPDSHAYQQSNMESDPSRLRQAPHHPMQSGRDIPIHSEPEIISNESELSHFGRAMMLDRDSQHRPMAHAAGWGPSSPIQSQIGVPPVPMGESSLANTGWPSHGQYAGHMNEPRPNPNPNAWPGQPRIPSVPQMQLTSPQKSYPTPGYYGQIPHQSQVPAPHNYGYPPIVQHPSQRPSQGWPNVDNTQHAMHSLHQQDYHLQQSQSRLMHPSSGSPVRNAWNSHLQQGGPSMILGSPQSPHTHGIMESDLNKGTPHHINPMYAHQEQLRHHHHQQHHHESYNRTSPSIQSMPVPSPSSFDIPENITSPMIQSVPRPHAVAVNETVHQQQLHDSGNKSAQSAQVSANITASPQSVSTPTAGGSSSPRSTAPWASVATRPPEVNGKVLSIFEIQQQEAEEQHRHRLELEKQQLEALQHQQHQQSTAVPTWSSFVGGNTAEAQSKPYPDQDTDVASEPSRKYSDSNATREDERSVASSHDHPTKSSENMSSEQSTGTPSRKGSSKLSDNQRAPRTNATEEVRKSSSNAAPKAAPRAWAAPQVAAVDLRAIQHEDEVARRLEVERQANLAAQSANAQASPLTSAWGTYNPVIATATPNPWAARAAATQAQPVLSLREIQALESNKQPANASGTVTPSAAAAPGAWSNVAAGFSAASPTAVARNAPAVTVKRVIPSSVQATSAVPAVSVIKPSVVRIIDESPAPSQKPVNSGNLNDYRHDEDSTSDVLSRSAITAAVAANKKSTGANPTGNNPSSLAAQFGGPAMSPELERWCRDQLKALTGSNDITLAHYLMSLHSMKAVEETVIAYFGPGESVKSFAANFWTQREFEQAGRAAEEEEVDKKGRRRRGAK